MTEKSHEDRRIAAESAGRGSARSGPTESSAGPARSASTPHSMAEQAGLILTALGWDAANPEPATWGGERAEARDAVASLVEQLEALQAAYESERNTAMYLDGILAKHHETTGWNCPVCNPASEPKEEA